MGPTLQSLLAALLATTVLLPGLTGNAHAQSAVVGWGVQVVDSRWSDGPWVQISAGANHTMARASDGSVVVWGLDRNGQCGVPALPSGLTYLKVSAGTDHCAAIRSDGSCVAWGNDFFGQCNVPALPSGLS